MITRQFVYFLEGVKEGKKLVKQEEEIEKLQGDLQRSQVWNEKVRIRNRVIWTYSEGRTSVEEIVHFYWDL